MIRGVLFSHRRLHKMRVTPGTRSAFGDETETDSLRCFGKKRDERRAVVAGEIQAEIESAPDEVDTRD